MRAARRLPAGPPGTPPCCAAGAQSCARAPTAPLPPAAAAPAARPATPATPARGQRGPPWWPARAAAAAARAAMRSSAAPPAAIAPEGWRHCCKSGVTVERGWAVSAAGEGFRRGVQPGGRCASKNVFTAAQLAPSPSPRPPWGLHPQQLAQHLRQRRRVGRHAQAGGWCRPGQCVLHGRRRRQCRRRWCHAC